MSPNENLPPQAPLPADASPETRAAYTALYAKYFPQQRVATPFNGATGTPAQQVQQPTFTTVPGTSIQIASGGADDGLSVEERGKLVEALRKHWTGSPDDLERAIAGKEAVQPREATTGDVFALPASPGAFEMRYPDDAAKALDMEDLSAFDREIKSSFYSAEFPPGPLAQAVLDALITTANSYPAGISGDGLKLRFADEGARLRNLSGGDGVETARLATAAYNKLPKDFRELVDQQFGFHSAEAQVALAAVGRAIEFRQSRAKK